MLKRTSWHAFLSLLLLACITLASSSLAQAKDKYVSYHNDRFSFSFLYPSNLTAMEEPENGDGRRFVCEKTGLAMTAYGSHRIDASNASQYANAMVPEGVTALRESLEKQSPVDISLSWQTSGRKYWVRTILHNDTFLTLMVDYPLAKDKIYRATAKRALSSLKPEP